MLSFLSQTLASPGLKGCGLFLSNKWKCNKKSGATVVHGSVSTSPFDLLKVKVNTPFEAQNWFYPQTRELEPWFILPSSTIVSCRLPGGVTEAQLTQALFCHCWGSVHSIPRFWLRHCSLEKIKIFCVTSSLDAAPVWNLMVCDCQAR